MTTIDQDPDQLTQRLARLDTFQEHLALSKPEDQPAVNRHALLVIGAVQPNGAFDVLDGWLRFPEQQKALFSKELAKHNPTNARSILAAGKYAVSHANTIIPGQHNDHHQFLASSDPNTSIYRQFEVYKSREQDLIAGRLHMYARQRLQLARVSIFGYMLYQKEQAETAVAQ